MRRIPLRAYPNTGGGPLGDAKLNWTGVMTKAKDPKPPRPKVLAQPPRPIPTRSISRALLAVVVKHPSFRRRPALSPANGIFYVAHWLPWKASDATGICSNLRFQVGLGCSSVALERYDELMDWSWLMDGVTKSPLGGGEKPAPTDRGKGGVKRTEAGAKGVDMKGSLPTTSPAYELDY